MCHGRPGFALEQIPMSAPSEFQRVLGFSLACREARPPGACRLGPA